MRKQKPYFFPSLAMAAVLFLPLLAHGQTVSDVQAELQQLEAQLTQLQQQSIPSACTVDFARTLSVGSTGTDVMCLQQMLNENTQTQIAASGSGSPGNETLHFGTLTRVAVIKFQKEYSISITGTVGPKTMAELNTLLDAKRAAATAAAAAAQATSSSMVTSTATLPVLPALESESTVVSNALPGVVSIIISQDEPGFQVTYERPFPNSRFEIPVFEPSQTGQLTEVGAGSGFIISSSGYVITNKHVTFDPTATYTVLLSNGVQEQGTIVYEDPDNDLAILKIPGGNYSALPLGDSSSLKIGEQVIAIGDAYGQYPNTVSLGQINDLGVSIQANDPETGTPEILNNLIDDSAQIYPGNSGGPLLDYYGNVIGIDVATASGGSTAESFAIPINDAKAVINSVLANQ
jgi:S1-C subfamily serine protease